MSLVDFLFAEFLDLRTHNFRRRLLLLLDGWHARSLLLQSSSVLYSSNTTTIGCRLVNMSAVYFLELFSKKNQGTYPYNSIRVSAITYIPVQRVSTLKLSVFFFFCNPSVVIKWKRKPTELEFRVYVFETELSSDAMLPNYNVWVIFTRRVGGYIALFLSFWTPCITATDGRILYISQTRD